MKADSASMMPKMHPIPSPIHNLCASKPVVNGLALKLCEKVESINYNMHNDSMRHNNEPLRIPYLVNRIIGYLTAPDTTFTQVPRHSLRFSLVFFSITQM